MKRISILLLVFLTCLATAAWAANHKIITFDPPGPPGAGGSPYQGTQSLAIAPDGTITGFYSDSLNVYYSFIRTPDGNMTTFEAPDAGTQSVAGFLGTPMGVLGGQGTYAVSINKLGMITGLYVDISNVLHGFLRAPDGTMTEFDVPGAGTGPGQGTNAGNISPNGTIAGAFTDTYGVSHGFLRTPKGKFITYDVPGAGTKPGQGTFMGWASCINPAGAVTGWYVDVNGVNHGFLRDPSGAFTVIDAPGAGIAAGQGTYAWTINQDGEVAAEFVDSNNLVHGYLRGGQGNFWVFDVPGAGKNAWQGTVPEGINSMGIIIGNFYDPNGVNYGFRRAWNGKTTRFRVPTAGTAAGQGTVPLTPNASGAFTGSFFDDNFVIHGFLMIW